MGTAQNRRVTENELRATTTSVQRKRRLISGSTAVAAAAAAAAVAVIQTAPADAGTYGPGVRPEPRSHRDADGTAAALGDCVRG